jgi:hypothetical protein
MVTGLHCSVQINTLAEAKEQVEEQLVAARAEAKAKDEELKRLQEADRERRAALDAKEREASCLKKQLQEKLEVIKQKDLELERLRREVREQARPTPRLHRAIATMPCMQSGARGGSRLCRAATLLDCDARARAVRECMCAARAQGACDACLCGCVCVSSCFTKCVRCVCVHGCLRVLVSCLPEARHFASGS